MEQVELSSTADRGVNSLRKKCHSGSVKLSSVISLTRSPEGTVYEGQAILHPNAHGASPAALEPLNTLTSTLVGLRGLPFPHFLPSLTPPLSLFSPIAQVSSFYLHFTVVLLT